MDNYNFTKGKWEIEYLAEEVCSRAVINNGMIDVWSIRTTVEEANANALLISKSPILLQAIYDSIEPLKKAGLKEMADYHEKIYLESVNL